MKAIQKQLKIGKGEDVSVFLNASIDGGAVIEEHEGDSLLLGFLGLLKELMVGPPGSADQPEYYMLGNEDFEADDFFETGSEAIQSLTTNSASTILIQHNSLGAQRNLEPQSNSGVYIWNVQNGNATAINGVHLPATWPGTDQFGETEIDGTLVGTEDVSDARITGITAVDGNITQIPYDFGDNFWRFRTMGLYLGLDNASNELEQIALNNLINNGTGPNELNYQAWNVAEPVVNLAQQISTITTTQDFNNDSGSVVSIGEVGVKVMRPFLSDERWAICIARDQLAADLDAGKTLTVNYRIRTSCSTDGGILVQFNEIFYRSYTGNNRTAQDIQNRNQSTGESQTTFNALYSGGQFYSDNNLPWEADEFNEVRPGDQKGIRLGTSNQAVDEADFDLQNPIRHGKAAGELFYHGMTFTNIVKDQANSAHYFDLIRIFENLSGSSITVEEAALTVYGGDNNHFHSIARHRTGGVTVADGELLKVTYRIQINVS